MKRFTNIMYIVLILTIALISCDKKNLTEPIAPPSAPKGVSATSGNGEVTISWEPVSGSTSYNLYWATAPGVTSATGTQILNVTSPYIHTGLTNGTTYYYIIVAVNEGGESPASDEVSATPGLPTTPPILYDISNPDGDWEYTVRWSAVSLANSYILEEDDNDNFSSPTTVYSSSDTSKSITGMDVGTYYYRVKASNTFGSSSWSNVVSVQVTTTLPVPEPGTWYGRTSWFKSVQFIVSSDNKSVRDLRLTLHGDCGVVISAGPVPIENGHFSFGWFSGDFTANDKASGSYVFMGNTPNCGFVIESGSWSASH